MSWDMKESCCSVAKSLPTLCDPVDYSMPGGMLVQQRLKQPGKLVSVVLGDLDNFPSETATLGGSRATLKYAGDSLGLQYGAWETCTCMKLKVDGGKQVNYATLLLEVLSAYGMGAETTSGPFLKFIIGFTELQHLYSVATGIKN